MVNVGYIINGKRGVIKNVMPISNTETEHLCFMQADGEEQYALKKEDIEYVIPSDIDCVSGKMVFDKDGITEYSADGRVIMQGRYVEDKPMTFADKFKEAFGLEPDKYQAMCDIVNCSCIDNCKNCIYYRDWDWDKPYVKVEKVEVED